MKNKFKHYAVMALVVFNIALAGAVAGAYAMHTLDTQSAGKTQNAVQAALKSVPVAVSLTKGQ